MNGTTSERHGKRWPARQLVGAGIGAALAIALFLPGRTLAAPQDAPCPQPVTLQCAINFGNAAIDKRITSLNTLNGKIQNALSAGHITSEQATSLSADVMTNKSGLTQLRAKLDGDTDLATVRDDIKSIYTTYRIYYVVLPRDYNEILLDLLTNVQAKMVGAEPKIQDAIAKLANLTDKDNDGDLATINAAYSDYQAQLSAALSQINTANGLLPQFTPQNFNADPAGYKANWEAFRGALRAGHGDLLASAADLHKITKVARDLVGDQHLADGASDTDEP